MKAGTLLVVGVCLWTSGYANSENCKAAEAINQFTVSLFRDIARTNQGNVVVSPVSVSILLSMLEQAASGTTEQELEKVLQLNKEDSRVAYRSLAQYLKNSRGNSSNILELANGIFIDKTFDLKREFKNTLIRDYMSAIETVQFGGGNVARTINDWVSQATRDRIRTLVQPGSLGADTVAVLVNAIYFKGLWSIPFEKRYTRKGLFSPKQREHVNVSFMHKKMEIMYGEDSELKISWIHLPFNEDHFSMIIMLPNIRFGLDDVLARMTAKDIANIISTGYYTEVTVSLPRFKLETNINLVPILQDIGLSEIFSNYAHLDGFSTSAKNLKISQVVQKAEIEVDENGATAAAATFAAAVPQSAVIYEEPVVFSADHPFIALIADTKNEIPLFLARVQTPDND